ncbi:tyrosine recombinase XerD-like [Ranitomeya imitator]|uniref:tyrosine recombinase XerD-like n=1 Tax=Ranitomeya imitator TaxID=111125 RepID=UPI0037E917AF
MVERNLSKNTVESYRFDIKDFMHKVNKSIDDVESSDIEDYMMNLFLCGKKPSTVNRCMCSIRRFFHFLHVNQHISENPAEKIEVPQNSRKLPKIIEKEAIEKILSRCEISFEDDGLREKLLVLLLYGSGLRVSEAISLLWRNIKYPFIRIIGKGNKERCVPIGDMTYEILQKWQNRCPIKSDYIFPSTKCGNYMTRQRAFQIIKKITADSGIDAVSPHVLRHAFATHILENGGNLMGIKKMLGHKNLSTTEIYMHVNQRALRGAVEKYHPFAALNKQKF